MEGLFRLMTDTTEHGELWMRRRIEELERCIVRIRRIGRSDMDNQDKVIDMRSAACRIRIDEKKYTSDEV